MKLDETLQNGARIISHRLPHLHSVTASVCFRVGSLYENEENLGISHLVEHLFFRKWDELEQDSLYRKMYSLGTEIRGETNFDYVRFSLKTAPDLFPEALKLLLMCLNRFHWTSEEIDCEKAVVRKQIENSGVSFENWLDSRYFQDFHYENSIMGTLDTLDNLSYSDINVWKDKYFCVKNSLIVITGGFSNGDLLQAKDCISRLDNLGNRNCGATVFPPNFCRRNGENRYTVEYADDENAEVVLFADIKNSFEYETVRLLSSILCEGCGSVLSTVMREKYAFTDDIFGDLMCFADFYRLSISYTVKNIELEESIKILIDTINAFKSHITNEHLASSIGFFTKNQLMDLDDEEALNKRYALSDFILKLKLSHPKQLKQKYGEITPADLQNAAEKILINENYSFLIETNIKSDSLKQAIENALCEDN